MTFTLFQLLGFSLFSIVLTFVVTFLAMRRQAQRLKTQQFLLAEQTALDSEQEFRSLADCSNVLMWTTGADSLCTWVNRLWCEYTGIPLEQHEGFGWTNVVHTDDREGAKGTFLSAFANHAPFNLQYRLRSSEGLYRWFSVNAMPRLNAKNEFCGYVGMSYDIHDARMYAEQLEAANEELEQFAYIASHDLKQPLRGMSNLANWVVEDSGSALPEQSRKHLKTLRERVTRLERLLDDLLSYSKIGRTKVELVEVDSALALSDALALCDPPEGHTISQTTDFPKVRNIPGALEQVFRNLVGNALKHGRTDGGSVIIAATAPENGFAAFTVTDNGPGIPAEYHDRIFRMFNTLRPRDSVEGSGMGLAIVRKLVEAHGGTIRVESAEGQETSFIFTWPLAA